MPRTSHPSFWRRLVRSKLTLFFGAVVLVVLLVSFGREIVHRAEVRHEVQRLTQQVDALEERRMELTNLIQNFQSPLFQEQEGREKLGLAKPGETVIIVPDGNGETTVLPGAPTASATGQARSANAAKWWDYFF